VIEAYPVCTVLHAAVARVYSRGRVETKREVEVTAWLVLRLDISNGR
jgi:hypothetical protein